MTISTTKPVLGLDLDGVIVDFNRMWIERYHEEFGELHHVEDITTWDYRKRSVDMGGNEFWRWCRSVRLWDPERTYVHEDNYQVALTLHKKYDIHIITSKPRWAQADTAAWLDASGIKFEALTFTRRKELVLCDYYVDDSPSNLDKLARAVLPRERGVVFRQERPWNSHVPGTYTIRSLAELP